MEGGSTCKVRNVESHKDRGMRGVVMQQYMRVDSKGNRFSWKDLLEGFVAVDEVLQ